jgi:hypothetical protein
MAIVPGQLEKDRQETLSMQLDRGDDKRHGAAVKPKLGRVNLKALIDHCL